MKRVASLDGTEIAYWTSGSGPPGFDERLEALLAAGEREAIVEVVFRELAGMSDEELSALRAQPSWQARVDMADTIGRELRAIATAQFDREVAEKITARTLLVTGADSTDPAAAEVDTIAAALTHARVLVLEGHGHVADVLAPAAFAEHVVAFLHADG